MSYRIFNIQEVSAYLHLKQADLTQLVNRAEIPFEQKGSRTIFHKNEIDSWASQRILGFEKTPLNNYHRLISAKTHDLSKNHLIVTELLHDQFVKTEITAKTKPSILRHMVQIAEHTGLVADPNDLLRSLEHREKLCSTALMDGIAILHPRHHEPYMFNDSFIAIGKTVAPIPFGAPDGKKTDIFFLVCCQYDRIHLHVLARICVMCKQTALLAKIRTTEHPHAIIEYIRLSEAEITKSS